MLKLWEKLDGRPWGVACGWWWWCCGEAWGATKDCCGVMAARWAIRHPGADWRRRMRRKEAGQMVSYATV